MKLNPTGLAAAAAAAFAIVWTACSILVAILPSAMSNMTGHMVHAHMENFSWMLDWSGYLIGLVAWSAWAAVTGWLIGTIYNFAAAHELMS
jgi:hypothetical protein